MRFHILGLSHTQTTREFSCCAFTQKVRLLCKMLTETGNEVFHYGTAGSDPVCSENVEVLSNECWKAVHGDRDWKRDGFNVDIDTPAQRQFVERAIEEIKKRAQDKDFLLCTFGHAHQPIAYALKNVISVESGIGYPVTFSRFRVFESYAWMNFIYGKEARETSPQFYDAVIPNYLDLEDYPFVREKDDYFMFVGRLSNSLKGARIAADVCKEIGAKLYAAGQGKIEDVNAEYLGVLNIEERAKWVSRAKALFCPTYYIEPFGTVNVEAQAYGTPVISTDFGAFSETVIHGVTGFRCRTFEQFVWAAKNIDRIDPANCRLNAERYSLATIARMYQEYFENLQRLFYDDKGWYFLDVQRSEPWSLM